MCVLLYVYSMHDIYAFIMCVRHTCMYTCMHGVRGLYVCMCMIGMHLCMYAYMRFVYVYVHGISGLCVFVCVTHNILEWYVCMYVCKHGIQVRMVWYV